MAAATPASAVLLGRQLKQMQTDKDIPGISCGLVDNNVYEWEVMLMISDECKYYGGESTLPYPWRMDFVLLAVAPQNKTDTHMNPNSN
jgi:ubiquitin-protein ligase